MTWYGRLMALLVAMWLGTAGFGAGAAWAADNSAADAASATGPVEMASLTQGPDEADQPAPLPRVLSDADIERYRQIFDLQVDGNWKAADKLIAKLDDRLLMGHVLAQRYLHPTKYRSKYVELRDWMAKYADLPDAQRIYKLALRRRPKNWKMPKPPVKAGNGLAALSAIAGSEPQSDVRPPRKHLSTAERHRVSALRRQIVGNLRNGWTLAAKRLIRSDEVKRLFDSYEYDDARGDLGARYLTDGHVKWALEWAGAAAKRSGKYLPDAAWTAGLAAWHLGDLDAAGRYFRQVAESPNSSPWMVSAGAFWAARAHLVNRDPGPVIKLLGVAAAQSRTFYGLLARRILGMPFNFRWTVPPLDEEAIQALAATPAGKRALALIAVGQEERAERDLRLLLSRSGPEMARGVMALASRAGMPSLAVRLNDVLFPDGGGFDGAAYPLPRWTPEEGFQVDRALVYALIRQESKFNPNAKSWAGARGLMQLMPSTASFVAHDRRLRGSQKHELYDPAFNLELGQKYIQILFDTDHVGDDLFQLAAAWNGGPGNLSKWQRQTDADDPLLFIESIPSNETRNFVERVLTNLWIYRDRLGQPAPSLDAIAAGERPAYIPLDSDTSQVARHVENNR